MSKSSGQPHTKADQGGQRSDQKDSGKGGQASGSKKGTQGGQQGQAKSGGAKR